MTEHRERFLRQAFPYEGLLREFLRRCARNPADAEDLLRQVYTRLLRQGDADTLVVKLVRCLAFTIAKRLAIDFSRARRNAAPPDICIDLMTEEEHCAANTIVLDVGCRVSVQQELQDLHSFMAALRSFRIGVVESDLDTITLSKVDPSR